MNQMVRSNSKLGTVFDPEKVPSHTRISLCFMLLTPVNPK